MVGVDERMSAKHKPYSELGRLLDTLARRRDVRGPYGIARHLHGAAGYEVSGQSISKYLYGGCFPKRGFMKAFADAFSLTPREQSELAWYYTYGFRPRSDGGTGGLRAALARGDTVGMDWDAGSVAHLADVDSDAHGAPGRAPNPDGS